MTKSSPNYVLVPTENENFDLNANAKLSIYQSKIGNYLKLEKIDSMLLLINKSLALIAKPYEILPKILKCTLSIIGCYYNCIKEKEESLKYFKKALEIEIETPAAIIHDIKEGITYISQQLGIKNQHLGNFSAAKQFFIQAIEHMNDLYDTSRYDPLHLMACYSDLSALCTTSKKHEGIKYYTLALEVKPNPGDNTTLSFNNPKYLFEYVNTSRNLATHYRIKEDYENALKYFHQAINAIPEQDILNYPTIFFDLGNAYYEIKNYEQATHYYEQIFKYGDELKVTCQGYLKFYFHTYLNMAKSYLHQEKYQEAISHFNNYLENIRFISLDTYISIKKNIGDAYFGLKDYNLAKENLNIALKIIFEKCNDKSHKNICNEIFKKIVEIDNKISEQDNSTEIVQDDSESELNNLVNNIDNLDLSTKQVESLGSDHSGSEI